MGLAWSSIDSMRCYSIVNLYLQLASLWIPSENEIPLHFKQAYWSHIELVEGYPRNAPVKGSNKHNFQKSFTWQRSQGTCSTGASWADQDRDLALRHFQLLRIPVNGEAFVQGTAQVLSLHVPKVAHCIRGKAPRSYSSNLTQILVPIRKDLQILCKFCRT